MRHERTVKRGILALAVAASTWTVGTGLRAARFDERARIPYAEGPFRWNERSAGTRELATLLAGLGDRLPRGARVLVVARPEWGGAGSFLYHWAQFFRPDVDWVYVDDARDAGCDFVLSWSPESAEPAWRRLAASEHIAFYRASG
ncbi:MAG: hypothetical protein U0X73_14100 [Thermoanaerobaculia bacterium]